MDLNAIQHGATETAERGNKHPAGVSYLRSLPFSSLVGIGYRPCPGPNISSFDRPAEGVAYHASECDFPGREFSTWFGASDEKAAG